MGRSHAKPVEQPDDVTCGPAALKITLGIFGIKKSLKWLIELCRTTKNGTSTRNFIHAINSLGFSVLATEYATLTHIQSALRYPSNKPRVTIVSYLYDLDERKHPHPDSGHWAVVSGFSASKNRLILIDSAAVQRTSYTWPDFRARWVDFDFRRKRLKKRGRKFQLVHHWQPQLMLVIAKDPKDLPKFTIATSKLFVPGNNHTNHTGEETTKTES